MRTPLVRAFLSGVLLSLLPIACGDGEPTEPGTDARTRMTVVVAVPSAPEGAASRLAIPPAVASVSIVILEPDCGGTVLEADTLNVTEADDSISFAFELEGPSSVCVSAYAHSEADATGTVVFEGSAQNVDLSVGGHIQVHIELGLVGVPAPQVTTLAASGVEARLATFHGSVTPGGFPTVAYFEWGTSTAYGSTTPAHSVGDGRDPVAIEQMVTGLAPEQTYHYRIVAINTGHVVYGEDATFTTLPANAIDLEFPELAPPTVTTDSVAAVGGSSALVDGSANPHGTTAWAYVEFGTDSTFGQTTEPQSIGADTIAVDIDVLLSGLAEGTTYHYRTVAFNAGGLSVGITRSFTTSGCTAGFEVPGNGQDDDCDGTPDNVEVCDGALALDTSNPLDAAYAVGLCRQAANPIDWGVVSARWVMPDGSDVPTGVSAQFATGHGVLGSFGSENIPQEGSAMLALSTGTARAPGDPGYAAPDPGYEKTYASPFPPDVMTEPSCETPESAHDAAGLEVVLRVPANATSFSFRTKYFTADIPEWDCTAFTDRFWTVMEPAITAGGNIAYDLFGNPISANSAGSTTEIAGNLTGTGFDAHGGSVWLTQQAPVTPGSEITLRFVIYDSGDGGSDSLVLLDDFRWNE